MKSTNKQAEAEIRDALVKERAFAKQQAEEAAEGIMREHEITPRVGRPPKKTKTLP